MFWLIGNTYMQQQLKKLLELFIDLYYRYNIKY